jgi:deoxycytidylate deaminase
MNPIENLDRPRSAYETGPELVVGLVGALGADLEGVRRALRKELSAVCYDSKDINAIELLRYFSALSGTTFDPNSWFDSPLPNLRYEARMFAGDTFRQLLRRGDALALLAVASIQELRYEKHQDRGRPIHRQAYLIKSMKHPSEVALLREIYGDGFVLVAAYCPEKARRERLTNRVRQASPGLELAKVEDIVRRLMQRDESSADGSFGQNTEKVFPLADVFVDATDQLSIDRTIARFVRLYFGDTFITPSREEHGMLHAQAAALLSASPARQVGAAIVSPQGEVIALGTNEVPRFGGGHYYDGDLPDGRDFTLNHDISDVERRAVFADMLTRLHKVGWLKVEASEATMGGLLQEAFSGDAAQQLAKARVMQSIEFVRAVHAEMDALTQAARLGCPVKGCTLFTTTFPCHDCARHIVAAGLKEVRYIEPYPTSLATTLYADSIVVDEESQGTKVSFRPFVGVAPGKYFSLFRMLERKRKDGAVVAWEPAKAIPRLAGSPLVYIDNEVWELNTLPGLLAEAGLQV